MSYLSIAASALFGGFAFLSLCTLWPETLAPSPRAGERGRRRLVALEKSGLFARTEPLVRVLATHIANAPLEKLRERVEARLEGAGRPLGLDANDYFAVSLILGGVGTACGALLSLQMDKGAGAGAILGAIIGIAFPVFKVDELVVRRRLLVGRGLPYAVDLAALSLAAGLDFTGALKQVISQLNTDDPIRFEFEHLLRKMALGSTRQDALKELAERIPTIQVRQFVGAVIQAEKRGTPLASVLTTQAEVMRTKRSQAAEQAAARAAILILGPLMLIFACVFVLLLGPFAIKFLRGELF